MKSCARFLFPSTCPWAQTPVPIRGNIQGRFTNQENTVDRLEIRPARLIVSGDPVSNRSYNVQADLAKAPYLMDAALTAKFSRVFRQYTRPLT